jgi:hypothetical protein
MDGGKQYYRTRKLITMQPTLIAILSDNKTVFFQIVGNGMKDILKAEIRGNDGSKYYYFNGRAYLRPYIFQGILSRF